MTEGWSLVGYDVEQLIGFGATSEVWRARELATGDTVALKRLSPRLDPAALEALRRAPAVLSALDTPYVVRVRAVVGDDGGPVLVLDHAAAGSLTALLARRGCLPPGEVVSIAAPLAQALAAAHARGLVHGDVSPANVLFRADGMPLLSDLGVAELDAGRSARVDGTAEYVDAALVRGGDPDAAGDVWALAAVCHRMLAGTPPQDGGAGDAVSDSPGPACAPLAVLAPEAPPALVAAVEAALHHDRAQRPDAAAFAALLRRSHTTAPVRLSGAASSSPPRPASAEPAPTHPGGGRRRRRAAPLHAAAGPRRRSPPRWALVWLVGVLALAAAATAGWASGRAAASMPALATVPPVPLDVAARPAAPAAEQPASSDAASVAEPDWVAVLRGLADARAAAFATGDPAALLAVYAPQAAALVADREQIAALEAAGRRADGVRHAVHVAELLAAARGSVRLRVVDQLADYDLRDPSGAVVQRVAGRPAAVHVVELVETPVGWRLSRIDRA